MAQSDNHWMALALALARKGLGRTAPNPPVGAVVVRQGRLIGQGWHRGVGMQHAEVLALESAGRGARGATLYVTLEPCCTWGRTPPCTDAVRSSGVTRVVIAVSDPNPRHRGRGIRILRAAGIRVKIGVCEVAARSLIAPFAKWITTGLPLVTLKLAMTLDGRIADTKGRSRWISGPVSRAYVQRLRRQVDAIVVGARTARLDNPRLLARTRGGPNPLRVVVARHRLPPHLRILTDRWTARTVVVHGRRMSASPDRQGLEARGVRVWALPETARGVSMRALLQRLGRQGCLHVVCEGGGELAASLLREQLVDRCIWFVSPRVLGAGGHPVVGGDGWSLSQAPEMGPMQFSRSGRDIRITTTLPGSRFGNWVQE